MLGAAVSDPAAVVEHANTSPQYLYDHYFRSQLVENDQPVNAVSIRPLAHAPALGDLNEVLEAGVKRLHCVVRDELSAAVLVVLGHAPGPGLPGVPGLEAELEHGGGPADGAVARLPSHAGGVALTWTQRWSYAPVPWHTHLSDGWPRPRC